MSFISRCRHFSFKIRMLYMLGSLLALVDNLIFIITLGFFKSNLEWKFVMVKTNAIIKDSEIFLESLKGESDD